MTHPDFHCSWKIEHSPCSRLTDCCCATRKRLVLSALGPPVGTEIKREPSLQNRSLGSTCCYELICSGLFSPGGRDLTCGTTIFVADKLMEAGKVPTDAALRQKANDAEINHQNASATFRRLDTREPEGERERLTELAFIFGNERDRILKELSPKEIIARGKDLYRTGTSERKRVSTS